MRLSLIFVLLFIHPVALANKYSVTAGNEKVCHEFVTQLNHQMKFDNQITDKVKRVTINYPTQKIRLPDNINEKVMVLDINNDGSKDLVFEYNDDRSYIHGSILYVEYDSGEAIKENHEITIDSLKIFPCQLSVAKPDSKDCPPLSDNAGWAGIDLEIGKEKVHFRGRYTNIDIRTYEDENYLQLIRNYKQPYNLNYAGIIKVKNKTEFESICLFSK